jgi:hypothetical protein
MTRTVTWIDRLRIERVVWMLDQRLYDLPRRSRIAKRREVRENLLAAAHDVGTTDALRHLGDGRRLAAEYLSAEFGDGPRHSWIAAAIFATGVPLLLEGYLGDASAAFGAGIIAADPNVTGTFTWSGIQYVQNDVTFHLADGHVTSVVGGAWGPVCWITWLIGTILVGRLWRLLPARARNGTLDSRK